MSENECSKMQSDYLPNSGGLSTTDIIICVVFWLVNTISSNNKTNHDMWGNSYIYRKEYLEERDC